MFDDGEPTIRRVRKRRVLLNAPAPIRFHASEPDVHGCFK